MANKDEISIVWDGLQEFSEHLDEMTKEFEKNLIEAITEHLGLVEEGAKALVQRDSGDLEESLTAKKPRIEGDRVVGEVGSNSKYAFKTHERPYSSGVYDKVDNGVTDRGYYVDGRGRRTRDKPNWRGEQPGRKYLERAVVLTEDDYDKVMAKALEKTLGGR